MNVNRILAERINKKIDMLEEDFPTHFLQTVKNIVAGELLNGKKVPSFNNTGLKYSTLDIIYIQTMYPYRSAPWIARRMGRSTASVNRIIQQSGIKKGVDNSLAT